MTLRKIPLLSVALFTALALGQAAHAEPVTYTIDPDHSLVMFEVDHLGFASANGWIGKVSGTIEWDAEDPDASRVEAELATDSIATNNAERDGWLKSDKMLDAAQHPAITFVSTGIEPTGEDTGRIKGDLTILGVSRPVVLDTRFNKAGQNPINKQETIGFSAEATLKRSDYGADAFLGPIGDEIRVRMDVEGILKK